MPDYISAVDIAAKWGITRRRVVTLCAEGRIPGAFRLGSGWAAPINAEKPADERIKSGKYVKTKSPEEGDGKYTDDCANKYGG